MKRATVLFVCSGETHVRTFAPVAGILAGHGMETIAVGLDAFYGQNAEVTGEQVGLPVHSLPRRGGPLTGRPFYRRPTITIWRDVIANRRTVQRLVRGLRPAVVVVGNDRGLMEKLFLTAAEVMMIRTVLVQDGRLTATRPMEATLAGRLRDALRRSVSKLLGRMGLRYLASSEYGAWGADIVCASGEVGRRVLSSRAPRRSRVVVTGQPRYDGLSRLRRPTGGESRPLVVAVFTTPFEASGLGDAPSAAQDRMVAELEVELEHDAIELWVKPHPREMASRYVARCRPTTRIVPGEPGPVLARASVAVVGISSVIEEAGLLRCPVIVPGRFLHGGRFDAHLPDRRLYPRFESTGEAVELVRAVVAGHLDLMAGQSGDVARTVAFDPTRPAAERVAEAILS